MTTQTPADDFDPAEWPNDERDQDVAGKSRDSAVSGSPVAGTQVGESVSGDPDDVSRQANFRTYHGYRKAMRRQLLVSVLLFSATFLSTFLVGSQFVPLNLAPAYLSPEIRKEIETNLQQRANAIGIKAPTLDSLLYESSLNGLQYAGPLMLILLCHELGHFIQSVRNRVPASFPYFIPLPLPPLGTMGAVILQGRGVANRTQMFDIAVTGPLAGLAVTLPILYYGIATSHYVQAAPQLAQLEFGEPLLIKWMITAQHGPAADGFVFSLNGIGFAGWVGVFITAMNLLPIGQLDGGHILYTLIGRWAHLIAMLVIAIGITAMIATGTYSYSILLILLMLTGTRHPPTADDSMPLGKARHLIGWVTMSFLIIGFTPQPIIIQETQPLVPRNQPARRADPEQVDPETWVRNDRTQFVKPEPPHFMSGTDADLYQWPDGPFTGLQTAQISHDSVC